MICMACITIVGGYEPVKYASVYLLSPQDSNVVFGQDMLPFSVTHYDAYVQYVNTNTSFTPMVLCQVFECFNSAVYSVAVSSDGKNIISGSRDNTMRIWNRESKCCETTLEGHSNWVLSVAVSPDGKHVVSGSLDKTVRIWDIDNKCCEATLKGHSGTVLSVAVSPDGKRVVSGSGDKTVRVWDLASGRCEATLARYFL
jgi:WD40 repeat protein